MSRQFCTLRTYQIGIDFARPRAATTRRRGWWPARRCITEVSNKKPRPRFRAEAFQKGAGNGARENQIMLLWLRKAEGSAGLIAVWMGISIAVPADLSPADGLRFRQ